MCRAWRQLARSPELLRDVDASVSVAAYEQLPAATRSLRAWLAAHASDQLHSLTVRLNSTAAYEYYADPAAWVEDYKEPASRAPAAAAAAAQLQAALAALGAAAPGLRHLRLHAAGMQLVLGDWAAELAPRLHSLEVDLLAQTEFFEHALGVAAPLHCFSALRELRLSAYHLVLPAAGLRLPLSLTKLHLSCEMDKPNEHGEFPEESLTVAPLVSGAPA